MSKDPRLQRIDGARLRVLNDHGVDAKLFAQKPHKSALEAGNVVAAARGHE